jgi:hypothetical protein
MVRFSFCFQIKSHYSGRPVELCLFSLRKICQQLSKNRIYQSELSSMHATGSSQIIKSQQVCCAHKEAKPICCTILLFYL